MASFPQPRRNDTAFLIPALSVSLLLALVSLSSCAPQFYAKRADRETKRILGRKSAAVPNVDDESLDISEGEPITLEKLERVATASEFLGEAAEKEKGARIISLAEALNLSINQNRRYLAQKESIYLLALDLTLVRHELAPIFSGTGGARWAGDALDGDPPPAPAPAAPEPGMDAGDAAAVDAAVVAVGVEEGIDELITTRTFARNQNLGFTMLQRTGARIAADFTSDFLRFIAGDPSVNNSRLAFSVVQPLLRGGGFKVTLENLTQAERNLLYSLRDFANFRREFIVDIVSRYYNILQARDTVRNNWIGYQGFLLNVEREEALAEEDRRTQADLGRIRQALLQSEIQWINAVRDYESQLDSFKIELGLPVAEKISLDEDELEKLGIINPKITREQAVEAAFVSRPDLQSRDNQVEDANRRIEVAKVQLQPGLDVVADYEMISDPGDVTPSLNPDRRRWSAGFDVDLPFDRKDDRNFYRSTLIEVEQAKRNAELARDEVRLQIYDGWRALEQARRNYDIGELSVDLAERRLDEQELLAELGRGEALDLVDAQQDLIDSSNQRTSALVEHTLARLRLWRDMGILFINRDGSWVTKLEEEGS